ncbi:hypothetical protein FNV43_RR20604 [Rhamnella rubrinervis]|uniref:Uncharacterized protein n=1 Tax=Rhamnella rubrinervis TaxID=2594499 RepID=A0A8K0GUQ8_9ROSA|nr:hypothetical protein FNV43_RR20604 [Rhamnella rubrinervis]
MPCARHVLLPRHAKPVVAFERGCVFNLWPLGCGGIVDAVVACVMPSGAGLAPIDSFACLAPCFGHRTACARSLSALCYGDLAREDVKVAHASQAAIENYFVAATVLVCLLVPSDAEHVGVGFHGLSNVQHSFIASFARLPCPLALRPQRRWAHAASASRRNATWIVAYYGGDGRTTAKAFAKDVFINQERKLGARRRSDTVLVSTINDADQGSADVAYRTPPAPYEKSKSLGSGGSMVARLKLKGIDGRAPPGVEPAA